MKTKTPRIIRVKDPRLRRFRKNLRLVLRAAVEKKLEEFRKDHDKVEVDPSLSESKRISRLEEVMGKIFYYSSLRSKHPLGCAICGVRAVEEEEDLLYNPADRQWYCERDYKRQQDYYKKNPHPWLPRWNKMYPPLPSKDHTRDNST